MNDNEYVECLIYAGWIQAGYLDDDYQRYLKYGIESVEGDLLDYTGWKLLNMEAVALGDEFDSLLKLNPDGYSRRMNQIVERCSEIDYLLGH